MAPPLPDYDVIVVGCGPVGAFTALLLCRYGLRVLVIEAEAAPYSAPRAVAIDDETTRLLGLAAPSLSAWMDQHVLKCPIDLRTGTRRPRYGSDGSSEGQLFGWSLVGPEPPFPAVHNGGYVDIAFFHQPAFEVELRRRLASEPGCTSWLGWRVGSVTETGASVAVGCTSTGGTPQVSRAATARFVLAADGGASGVRKGLGIPFEGSSAPDEPWLVIDVEAEDPALCARWQFFNFVSDGRRPFVHVPLPGPAGGRRFEFVLLPHEAATPEATRRAQEPAACDALLRSIGVDPASVRVVRRAVYVFHARQAATWRAGRVVLAGDAAHCMPPFRGQGMCAGIRDAANVAWKLAESVAGENVTKEAAPAGSLATTPGRRPARSSSRRRKAVSEPLPATAAAAPAALASPATPSGDSAAPLLRTYQVERQGHLRGVIAVALAMGRLVALRMPGLRHIRNIVVGAAYHCPVTRPFFKEPFAPPSALGAGLFDFHGADGVRSWQRKGPRAAALRGWRARDEASGRLAPNCVVGSASSGAESRLLLDHALRRAATSLAAGQLGTVAGSSADSPAPPTWTLLCAPHTSAAPWGDAAGRGGLHPLSALPERVRLWAAASAGGAARPPGVPPSSLLVVQLLPACGAGIRIARHERWQRECVSATGEAVSFSRRGSSQKPGRGRTGAAPGASAEPAEKDEAGTSRRELAEDEAYRRLIDGDGAPSPEPWFRAAHIALADAAAAAQLWFDARCADAVLLRPDGYVYGAYTASELPDALVAVAVLLGTAEHAAASDLINRYRAHPLLVAVLAAFRLITCSSVGGAGLAAFLLAAVAFVAAYCFSKSQ